MKATLLLTEVVLLVVLGETFSSAKTINSLERNENSEFEKRWNEDRVRRDFLTFQSQINAATSLSLAACSPVPCTSDLSLDLCNAFCQPNKTAFGAIMTSLYACYQNGICGRNFSSAALTNVNVSLLVDGYDGQCTLYGSNVTMSLINTPPATTQLDFPSIAAYTVNNNLLYSFQGLSFRCQPNLPVAPPPLTSPNTTCDCQKSCAGGDQTANNNSGQSSNLDDNQNDDFSLARHLLVLLGVDVFSCDCNKDPLLVEKRQVGADSAGASFESTVSVNTTSNFQPVFIYSPAKSPFTQLGAARVYIDVTFGSEVGGIPSMYQNQVLLSISNVFANYLVYQFEINNFMSIMNGLVEDFRTNKCPSTCNI